MRRIFENAALIFVVIVVVFGFGYSVYTSVFSTTAEKTDKAIENQIRGCQRALSRSIIIQNFMLKAAATRRASAAQEAAKGNKVGADNDLAAAKEYEKFAEQYDALTTKNCTKEYGQ